MKIRTVIAALALSTAFVSGCGGGESTVTDDPATGSNASSEDAVEEESPEPEEPTEAPAANPKFGEAVTYDNGLQITVGAPKNTKISDTSAMSNEWPSYQEFEVIVVNNSTENFDAAAMYFSMQSADQEAEEIFDSANGFNGTPTTTVLPGRQSKFKVGFGVTDPADMVMEVSTGDFSNEATIFTN